MAGALSQYSENIIAGFIRGTAMPAPPTDVFLALSSSDPTDNGTGMAELSGGGYARQTVSLGPINTTNATGTSVSNAAPIAFTNISGTATHYAVFDAPTGGNMLFYGPLSVTRVVTAGDSVSFAVGVVKMSLAGFVGATLGEAFIGWVAGTAPTFLPTTTLLGLSVSDPLIDGSGVDYPEITDGYAHKQITFATPSFVQGQGTTISSDNDIVFGPAVTNSWGTITHAVVLDQNDNILLQGPVSDPTLITVGQGLGIVAGAIAFKVT